MTNPDINKSKAVIGTLGMIALMSYLAHLWPVVVIAALLTVLISLLYEVSLSLKYVEAFLPNIAGELVVMRGRLFPPGNPLHSVEQPKDRHSEGHEQDDR